MKSYTVLAVVVILAATYVATTTQAMQAVPLSLEPPPPPALFVNGSQLNLTADDKDRDITIDPLDELPANGTVTISTALATDMDINDFPPVGVSVLIQNQTITVTNHTVTVGNDFTDQAVESDDDDGDDE